MHLRQPGFTYNACGPFTKIKKEYKNSETQRIQDIFSEINQIKLDDMAYGDFKDLPRGTASVKVLRDKAFHIVKSPKYDGYQRGLASMIYKLFEKNFWWQY